MMITVNFSTDVSSVQKSVFASAARRWETVLDTNLPIVNYRGRRIEGIEIDAAVSSIDGPGGILGQAGPTILRPDSRLPALGIMEFDTKDLAQLEADGSFSDVILHEMGHVLGAGTLWSLAGLLKGEGTDDPSFTGANASREYGALLEGQPVAVPVANTGGAGTRDGHWREISLGDELMTGFLSGSERPLSRVTVGAFEDLGYRVDYDAADSYRLPSDDDLLSSGVIRAIRSCLLCRMQRPAPIILGRDALLV